MNTIAMPRPPYGDYPPDGYVSVHYWCALTGMQPRLVMDWIHSCRFKQFIKLRGRYYMKVETKPEQFRRKRA